MVQWSAIAWMCSRNSKVVLCQPCIDVCHWLRQCCFSDQKHWQSQWHTIHHFTADRALALALTGRHIRSDHDHNPHKPDDRGCGRRTGSCETDRRTFRCCDRRVFPVRHGWYCGFRAVLSNGLIFLTFCDDRNLDGHQRQFVTVNPRVHCIVASARRGDGRGGCGYLSAGCGFH